MVWLAYVIYAVIQILISAALIVLTAKDPKSNLKAKGLDDFDFPTAEEDRAIPYIVGDVLVTGPNLTWYGDLATKKITEKVAKNGVLGNHKNVTVGFEYYVGFEIVLCLGPVDQINEIWAEDKLAWSGTVTTNDVIRINQAGLFGGKKKGGGLRFYVDYRNGSAGQSVVPYMAAVAGFNAAPYGYRHSGICKLVFRGPTGYSAPGAPEFTSKPVLTARNYGSGYVGEYPTVTAFKARLKRYPNTLGIPSGHHILPSGANPAAVLYELITGSYFPYTGTRVVPGLEAYEVDNASFLSAAETLFTEDMGISFQWQRDNPPRDLIDDVLMHINGTLRENPSTGKVELMLFRADFVVGELPVFDRSNILELEGLQRQTINAMVNRVTYTFTDTTEGFPERTAAVVSNSGLFMSGAEAAASLDLAMFHNPTAANRRAQTHLNSLCSPVFSGTMVCDLRAWEMRLGSRFVLNWDSGDPDISSVLGLVCMVNKIDHSELSSSQISLGFSQDVFSLGNAVFQSPGDSEWEPPSGVPGQVTLSKVFEVPYALLGGYPPNVLALIAQEPNQTSVELEVAADINTTGYAWLEEIGGFSPVGILIAAVPASAFFNVTPSSLSAWRADMSAFIYDAEAETVEQEFIDINYLVTGLSATTLDQRKVNLFLIDNEIVGIIGFTQEEEGVWSLYHVLRGMYGTLPAPHAEGALIWKVGQAMYLDAIPLAAGDDWALKLRAYSYSGYLALEDITAITGTTLGTAELPYPPGDFSLDSQEWGTTTLVPVNLNWNRRDKTNASLFYASQSGASFGESYIINIRNSTTNALLRTVTQSGNSLTYTALMSQEDGDVATLRVEIITVVATVESPPLVWDFTVTGGWL